MPLTADALEKLADGYTAAWNTGSADAVAGFYAEDGQITINRGDPWLGRTGVRDMAAGFFADVPDLVLTCNGIRAAGDHVLYLWTFTGHDAGTKTRLRSMAGRNGPWTMMAKSNLPLAGTMSKIMPGRWKAARPRQRPALRELEARQPPRSTPHP